jgi:hypothetical protein
MYEFEKISDFKLNSSFYMFFMAIDEFINIFKVLKQK